MTDEAETFGERMARLKRERGQSGGGPGRKPIADKYKPFIEKAERVFARAMPDEAERYVDELAPKEPERCPRHHHILCCPEPECGSQSVRTAYDHKAAAYLFDRMMGKPTNRSENTVTVNLVQQLSTAFVAVFLEVNELNDPNARRQAFVTRCLAIGDQFGGEGA